MFRSLLTSAFLPFLALAFAATALADGGGATPGVVEGGPGIVGASGQVRYFTLPVGQRTMLEAVGTTSGELLNWTSYPGGWGIPAVAYDGSAAGLSISGSTLVLAESGFGTCTPTRCTPLRAVSRFQVIDPTTFRRPATLKLRGDFAFDALSPSGRRLYLIQHVSATNLNRYLVRTYNLRRHALLPGAIADRTQRGWVMQGSPMARATSPDGRFVYTLYQNPGGYPFVHALDSVAGTAHCTGVPWGLGADQSVLGALKLSSDGRRLSIGATRGRMFFTMDTRTYRLTKPGAGDGHWFAWWMLSPGALALLLGVALRRRPWRRALRTVATAALR